MIASVFWILHSEQFALSIFEMKEQQESVSFFSQKASLNKDALWEWWPLSVFSVLQEKKSLLYV